MAFLDIHEGVLEAFADAQAPYSDRVTAFIEAYAAERKASALEASRDWKRRNPERCKQHARASEDRRKKARRQRVKRRESKAAARREWLSGLQEEREARKAALRARISS